MAAAPDNASLEELISRLEEITRTMENPDTGLESSIALYQEGLSIAERCRKRLREARQKIEVINPAKATDESAPPASESQGGLFGPES